MTVEKKSRKQCNLLDARKKDIGEKTPGSLKIGIFGGTFNPVHFGHLRTAEEVYERLGLSKIIFIPASRPPHKNSSKIVSFVHRWKMLELAIGDNPHFCLSDIENKRPGKSYSVDTLLQLKKIYPKPSSLYFLLGIDAFQEITSWKEYKKLFELTSFVILARPGYNISKTYGLLRSEISDAYEYIEEDKLFAHPTLENVYFCEVTLLDISSTRIRELVSGRLSIKYLVPDPVRDYIEKTHIYINDEEGLKYCGYQDKARSQ